MNELMTFALLVMQAGIIAGIGYTLYRIGYSRGNKDGIDMQKLLSKAFGNGDDKA